MTPLYAYSMVPVLAVALLLLLSLLRYSRDMLGLKMYCAAIAVWSGVLLVLALPGAPGFVRRCAQVGAFVCAGFIHAAYDFTRQRNYTLVWLAYAVALGITMIGVVWPGLLYAPVSFLPGPGFWPAHALAIAAALIPLWQIGRAYPAADSVGKRQLRTLAWSGGLGFLGAWLNSLALTHGIVVPYPMFMVLASLLLLTGLLRQAQQAAGRRLLDRSLLYAGMTAFLWAGFLFGVMTLMDQGNEPFLRQYRLGALFLVFMAALAFEPLRQHFQDIVSRVVLTDHAAAAELATELARQEQRADQAGRLAELGAFASAVAHEIRNPLGVISAQMRALQAGAAPAEVGDAVRQQVQRASTFIEDLLRYGRPRPLDLRLVDLPVTMRLAQSAALNAHPEGAAIVWLGFDQLPAAMIEADQAQLTQVFLILFENAIEALAGQTPGTARVDILKQPGEVRIRIEDSGPGIAPQIQARLFQPFVTGKKRAGQKSGNGLGLAIARGIIERHQGSIQSTTANLGGACFEIRLPAVQRIVAQPSGAAASDLKRSPQ